MQDKRRSTTNLMTDSQEWPAIPFDTWTDTCAALYLYTQMVGKYRLAHTL